MSSDPTRPHCEVEPLLAGAFDLRCAPAPGDDAPGASPPVERVPLRRQRAMSIVLGETNRAAAS